MSYRYMRLIVLFDLPMETYEEVRRYNKFRKFLLREGFLMMQKSVYVKLCLNSNAMQLIKSKVRSKVPKEGLVQMFNITEKQYVNMEYLSGNKQITTIDTKDRILIL